MALWFLIHNFSDDNVVCRWSKSLQEPLLRRRPTANDRRLILRSKNNAALLLLKVTADSLCLGSGYHGRERGRVRLLYCLQTAEVFNQAS